MLIQSYYSPNMSPQMNFQGKTPTRQIKDLVVGIQEKVNTGIPANGNFDEVSSKTIRSLFRKFANLRLMISQSSDNGRMFLELKFNLAGSQNQSSAIIKHGTKKEIISTLDNPKLPNLIVDALKRLKNSPD